MRMSHSLRATAVAMTTLVVVSGLQLGARSYVIMNPGDPTDHIPLGPAISATPMTSTPATLLSPATLVGTFRPTVPSTLRVAIVSSGITTATSPTTDVLPKELSKRVSVGWGESTDTFGYGTHAASIVAQLVPSTTDLSITSFNAYTLGKFRVNLLYAA